MTSGVRNCLAIVVMVASLASLATAAEIEETNIIDVLAAAPIYDPAAAETFKPTEVLTSPCTIISASLTSARCVVLQNKKTIEYVDLEFGSWSGDKWQDTLDAETRATLVKQCNGYEPTDSCSRRLRGFAYRAGRTMGNQVGNNFRVYNILPDR